MTTINAVVAPAERRVHARLREVFAEAIELVRPFFDGNAIWCGVPLGHFAQRVLRERFPELTAAEIYIFVMAARRVYAAERNAPRAFPHPTPSPAGEGTELLLSLLWHSDC
jgi:hypothetical protein